MSQVIPLFEPASRISLIDYHRMEDRELESRLSGLLADHTLHPRTPLVAFDVWLRRRQRAVEANPESAGLTVDERVCVLVLNLDAQVYNGGIEQWVDNGYAFQFEETFDALERIGARRLKRIIERAVSVLPERVREHLRTGEHSGWPGWLHLSARREERLHRLSHLYYSASDSGSTLDEHLLRFVRSRRIGPTAS